MGFSLTHTSGLPPNLDFLTMNSTLVRFPAARPFVEYQVVPSERKEGKGTRGWGGKEGFGIPVPDEEQGLRNS